MAVIHFLGTCSGTEPMPGMHHCCVVLESGGQYYWFDAGESCSYTAHTTGLNVLNIRAIFISHPHIDHIGGLANLFQCMKKLISRGHGRMIHEDRVDIYFPGLDTLQAVKLISSVARSMTPGTGSAFDLIEHEMADGLIFQDEHVAVTALHNRHLKEDGTNGWHSFSFLIETEGKRILFSGDVAAPEELDPLVKDGCDLLIMETGHHKVTDVCDYAASRNIPRLRFNHHGREIINERERWESYTAQYAKAHKMSIVICKDGRTEEV